MDKVHFGIKKGGGSCYVHIVNLFVAGVVCSDRCVVVMLFVSCSN